MGRFMSPDWSAKEDPVPYAQLDDPQSLNLYAYVRNNPLARTDPDGHCCEELIGIATDAIEDFAISHPGVVDAVAGPLVESASSSAGSSLLGSALGIGTGVVGGIVGAMINPATVSAGDLPAEDHGPGPEPQVSTSGAGARQGGGPPYENTPENQARMAQGKPPIGKDGKPVELHHTDQTQGGGTQEMTRTDHRTGTNFAANHTNTGQKQSQIDRNKFAQQRRSHWKAKVKPKPTSWRPKFRSRPHSQWVTAHQNRWTTVRKAVARIRES
jgi:hypothetical protein